MVWGLVLGSIGSWGCCDSVVWCCGLGFGCSVCDSCSLGGLLVWVWVWVITVAFGCGVLWVVSCGLFLGLIICVSVSVLVWFRGVWVG